MASMWKIDKFVSKIEGLIENGKLKIENEAENGRCFLI